MKEKEIPSDMDQREKNPNDSQNSLIRARHLKKTFGQNTVIGDVSFDLNPEENLAVMGKSGTGKSVLIKCIVGLMTPDEGELQVLDYDLMNIDPEKLDELRRSVGFLFQGGALYDSMTVERNLKFPLRRLPDSPGESEIDDRVDEVLMQVGLEETKKKYPSELSGGMKKRIALARTIIMQPKIMLYDEPTTGLDVITSSEISDLILEMRKKYKMASLIITHDVACVEKTADRILILDDGKVLEQGKYEDIRNNEDKQIRSYFEPV